MSKYEGESHKREIHKNLSCEGMVSWVLQPKSTHQWPLKILNQ